MFWMYTHFADLTDFSRGMIGMPVKLREKIVDFALFKNAPELKAVKGEDEDEGEDEGTDDDE